MDKVFANGHKSNFAHDGYFVHLSCNDGSELYMYDKPYQAE